MSESRSPSRLSGHFDAWALYCEIWHECFPRSALQPTLSVAVLGIFADRLLAAPSETRDTIIEEVAKDIESAPLTYAGPDPQGIQDMRLLIVWAIRDMKGKK